MADDALVWRHKQWLSEIQPVGLVVSPPALERFGLVLERLDSEAANRFRSHCGLDRDGLASHLIDLPAFAFDLLGWCPDELLGAPQAPPLPLRFQPFLEDLHLHLRPSYVLVDPDDADGDAALLIRCEPLGLALDRPSDPDDSSWQISPMNRFLRLLRETAQPVGLLCNGQVLRLIYAPKGESPGYMDFPVRELAVTAGRDMLAALSMLLNRNQLLGRAPERRLTALMKESRKYQNEVSNLLAEQVQVALDALLHGFQTADPNLLCERSGNTTDHVYGGLLTVMMRLVFILYAENQGLMPDDPIYTGSYALAGLFERLEADETHYPDTMDQRFGAWAQLLTLFRLIFRGGAHGTLVLTARSGQLFHPDSFPFLEGRIRHQAWSDGERLSPPAVPDATVLAVLRNLLVLGGERLSYRSLDVETIGSVYEAMMGFQIEVARYPSLALGKFSVVVDLVALLAEAPKKRKDYLKSQASLELSPKLTKAVAAACDQDQLVAALESRISKRRPHLIAPGGLYLQPGEERRKTGSHYTPRELTEPIVRHTLEPVLAALGPQPSPEQLLELKICDPAMGSGAFLVETCRFLGDRLVAAWDFHKTPVAVPPDEDRVIHARRLIAGRCLYGIDKNPFATSLAKLSLWLVTLAKEHPFTFLDHALKCGDTLLGLSQQQITAFHWLEQKQAGPLHDLHDTLEIVSDKRRQIHKLGDSDDLGKHLLHRESEDRLDEPRLIADLILLAFFQHDKTKDREAARIIYKDRVQQFRYGHVSRKQLEDLRQQLYNEPEPQRPFHIELEFPEVFDRANPGFDAFVGNPPFCGGSKISTNFGDAYLAWVLQLHPGSHGNGDLVAHFFRRAFGMLREGGSFGLIATNTISQGDTRNTGLTWICENGGSIYFVRRRLRWPGAAAVVVSVICLIRGNLNQGQRLLDESIVPSISAFLAQGTWNKDPVRLAANKENSYRGVMIYGNGLTFDDTDKKGVASSLAEMERLIQKDPRNQELIHPYLGGEEVNSSPAHKPHRYVINFKDMTLISAQQFPDLLKIAAEKVKPERDLQKREGYKKYWWRFGENRPGMFKALKELGRFLVISEVTSHISFTFLPTQYIPAHTLKIITLDDYASFCTLQSNFHEIWARNFGSSMKDDLRYTPSDCFETFPFPLNWREDPVLEAAGKAYFEYRAQWMVDHDLGMTKTYNLFHDPEEADNPSIERLRALHREMDQAVLAAYGWDQQVTLAYAYLLDYEDDEDEGSKRKKPWRYRWTDEVRDQVLALLLELNQQRAEEERRGPASDQLKHQKKQADALLRQPLPVKDKDVNYDQLPLFGHKS